MSEGHVEAVFDDRGAAENAVEGLAHAGFTDRIGVAIRLPEGWATEGDLETDRDVLAAIEKGIAAGIPAGVLAGLGIVALAIPGIGTLGVAGILGAGGVAGLLAGTYFGAMLGLASDEHDADVLEPGQVLVIVHGDDRASDATTILRRHGGRIVRG